MKYDTEILSETTTSISGYSFQTKKDMIMKSIESVINKNKVSNINTKNLVCSLLKMKKPLLHQHIMFNHKIHCYKEAQSEAIE